MSTIRHFFSTHGDQLNNTLVVTTAASLSWLQNRFGVFTALFVITAAVMLCDLLTRIYAVWGSPTEKVESAKATGGLRKKPGYCLLIFVGLLMDIGLQTAAQAIGLTDKLKSDIIARAYGLGARYAYTNDDGMAGAVHIDVQQYTTTKRLKRSIRLMDSARAFRRMQLQEKIDYRYVLHDTHCGRDILDELVELMLNIITSSKKFLSITAVRICRAQSSGSVSWS